MPIGTRAIAAAGRRTFGGRRLRPLRLAIGLLAPLLPALLAALLAAPARADWSDDFDGGFSNLWSFVAFDDAGEPPATGFPTWAVVDAGADDHLLMAHSTTALQDGGGGAADAVAWVDEIFTNVAISADVNAAPAHGQQSVLGVLARGDAALGTGYLAAVDFSASRFIIARSDDLVDYQTPIAIDDALLLDPNATYHIQFFLIGSSLTARLLDGTSHALLSTLSVNDARFASGRCGLLVETAYQAGAPIAPIVGTFDEVEALPEPSPGSAIAATCLALLALGRRRRERPRGGGD
jgi:hypothetical protein